MRYPHPACRDDAYGKDAFCT